MNKQQKRKEFLRLQKKLAQHTINWYSTRDRETKLIQKLMVQETTHEIWELLTGGTK